MFEAKERQNKLLAMLLPRSSKKDNWNHAFGDKITPHRCKTTILALLHTELSLFIYKKKTFLEISINLNSLRKRTAGIRHV